MSRNINRTAGANNRSGSRPRRRNTTTPAHRPTGAVRPRTDRTVGQPADLAKKERVRLELMQLEIDKKANRGWDPYFVFAFQDPGNPNKSLVSIWPEYPIEMKKASNNKHNFAGGGRGADGKEIYSIDMPADRQISLHAFVFQDKGKARRSGALLKEVTGVIDKGAKSLGPAAAANPYVAAAVAVNKGLNVVGGLLSKIKDKNRGFVSMDEKIGSDFVKRKTQRRVKRTSTGEIILTYRWIVEKVG